MDCESRTVKTTFQMTEQEIYQQLSKQSPTGYKLNELIPFSYPVRRIKLELLVNKQPDGSLVKVYNVLLRAIQAGFQSQEKLFEFLGLGTTDEFILRELFSLREKDYINIISETDFIRNRENDYNCAMQSDNSILILNDFFFRVNRSQAYFLTYRGNMLQFFS